MDKPHRSTGAICRTLAHALKRLFKSVKAQNADNLVNTPIDIIRKDVNRKSLLPRISTVSLFPNFECPEIDYDTVADYVPAPPMSFHASNRAQDFDRTLLPAKSLSHFNLHQAYTDHRSDLPILREADFRQGDPAVTLSTGKVQSYRPQLVSKKSTLLIRRPESLHATISNASLAASYNSDSSSSGLRRTKGSGNLRECASAQSLEADTPSLTPIAEEVRATVLGLRRDDPFQLVKHFASFCIIDILAPGCPVSAVSEDLRYLYNIKERFVLNAHECSQLSMDLSVGRDPDGNEVTYVLLFSPLMSPGTAKSRFMLVSAIDVSGYVRYAASLESTAEVKEETQPLTVLRKRSHARRKVSSRSWIDERTDQLADELLHGCSIKDACDSDVARRYRPSQTADFGCSEDLNTEDIWTLIAREEGLMSRQCSSAFKPAADIYGPSNPLSCRKPTKTSAPTNSPSTLNYGDEKVLEKFIQGLQVLYSQYFLLSCSPLNSSFYEICYVSPAVHASGEYVSGHLSQTPFNLINDFGAHLSAGRRFRTTIRWGNDGVEKQIYCVPLIGQQPAPWICMLVDKETPIRW